MFERGRPDGGALNGTAAAVTAGDEKITKRLGRAHMDLTVWLPAMFLLGLVSMGLCYVFIGACEKI